LTLSASRSFVLLQDVRIFTFNKINSSKTVEKNNDLAKTKSENEANYLVLLWSKLDFFLI
jgi:hypothetical protein